MLMILPTVRDRRLITVRRGGTLTDELHRRLALWAAECAEHVLPLFAAARPKDGRPQEAVDAARAWVRGEIKMMRARDFAGAAQDAAREAKGTSEAARMAALSAGQGAAVAHVAEHALGAAAYALRAVMEAAPQPRREAVRAAELAWQTSRLPDEIRGLVLEDMERRNALCWNVFIRGLGNQKRDTAL
jgi:hypothetical protein